MSRGKYLILENCYVNKPEKQGLRREITQDQRDNAVNIGSEPRHFSLWGKDSGRRRSVAEKSTLDPLLSLARTRRGPPCQSPSVAGKTRCRMHGGAAGSGAPKGKRNGKYRRRRLYYRDNRRTTASRVIETG